MGAFLLVSSGDIMQKAEKVNIYNLFIRYPLKIKCFIIQLILSYWILSWEEDRRGGRSSVVEALNYKPVKLAGSQKKKPAKMLIKIYLKNIAKNFPRLASLGAISSIYEIIFTWNST